MIIFGRRLKDNWLMKILIILFFAVTPVVVLGAANPSQAVIAYPTPSWIDHIDVVRALIGGLFAIIGFFVVRLLLKFDRNNSEIFRRLKEVESKHAWLEGYCAGQHGRKKEG